jgi:hypothetical protein
MPWSSGVIAATAAFIVSAVGATNPAPLCNATGVRSSARADARSVTAQSGPLTGLTSSGTVAFCNVGRPVYNPSSNGGWARARLATGPRCGGGIGPGFTKSPGASALRYFVRYHVDASDSDGAEMPASDAYRVPCKAGFRARMSPA